MSSMPRETKDKEMAAKGAKFLAQRAEEALKSGGVPLSALIANALAIAKSDTLDVEALARPAKPLGEADAKLVRSIMAKAAMPSAKLSELLSPELAKIWSRKKAAQAPSPENRPQRPGQGKAAANGKAQAAQAGKKKPAGAAPVIVVKKSLKKFEAN